jgi:hypothetical protein
MERHIAQPVERVDYDVAYGEGDWFAPSSPRPLRGGVGGGVSPPEPTQDLSPPPLFGPAQQVVFCDALALHGNARAASAAAGISPQTAYRTRHRCAQFRAMWDAALVLARSAVEQVLADRALNGVEEAVFYHGEEVATRRRYDSRLLLAHLARLDKLAEAAEVRALADRFGEGLAALEAGERVVEEASGEGAGDEVGPCPQARPRSHSLPAGEGESDPEGEPDPDEVPLLEAQLLWLEARYGTLTEEEEIFHLQNTVPCVPARDLMRLYPPPETPGDGAGMSANVARKRAGKGGGKSSSPARAARQRADRR